MSEAPEPSCEFSEAELDVRLDVTLPADVRRISQAVERVMQVVRQTACAAGHELDVELALREALANAIRHGSGGDASKQVQCCVACDAERGMLIVVRDEGPGFDVSQIPSPVHAENIYSHHGRGIFLINQLMDEVRFERGGTELHMRKRPPAKG